MREIEYRGFRRKAKEWVYGYLVERKKPYLHDIVVPIGETSLSVYSVERDSIGQYTGVKDVHGVKIYEGDIVKYEGNMIGEVYYDEAETSYILEPMDKQLSYEVLGLSYDLEVIGNIHGYKEEL